MRVLRQLIVILLLAGVLCAQAGGGGAISLIEPGSYHGNELRSGVAGNWLALVRHGTGYAWQTVAVRVVKERDEIVDGDGPAETGKRAEIIGGDEAVLLLRGLPDVLGTVIQPVITQERSLGAHESLPIEFSATRHLLRVTGTDPKADVLGKGSTLELSDGTKRQVLYSLPEGGDEPDWSVLWAGDMDGDGRLDLYVNVTNHYNVTNHTLFLSSLAKPGELVGRAGVVTKTGC